MQSKTAETVEESGELKGEFLIYRTNKVPLIDEDGEVYGICGIGFDITQEKRAKEEREELIKQLDLKDLKRGRTLIEWKVDDGGVSPSEAGFGYISELLCKTFSGIHYAKDV